MAHTASSTTKCAFAALCGLLRQGRVQGLNLGEMDVEPAVWWQLVELIEPETALRYMYAPEDRPDKLNKIVHGDASVTDALKVSSARLLIPTF